MGGTDNTPNPPSITYTYSAGLYSTADPHARIPTMADCTNCSLDSFNADRARDRAEQRKRWHKATTRKGNKK